MTHLLRTEGLRPSSLEKLSRAPYGAQDRSPAAGVAGGALAGAVAGAGAARLLPTQRPVRRMSGLQRAGAIGGAAAGVGILGYLGARGARSLMNNITQDASDNLSRAVVRDVEPALGRVVDRVQSATRAEVGHVIGQTPDATRGAVRGAGEGLKDLLPRPSLDRATLLAGEASRFFPL